MVGAVVVVALGGTLVVVGAAIVVVEGTVAVVGAGTVVVVSALTAIVVVVLETSSHPITLRTAEQQRASARIRQVLFTAYLPRSNGHWAGV